jgi:ATP-binding cassette, subfamily B, multidrug efflux pump
MSAARRKDATLAERGPPKNDVGDWRILKRLSREALPDRRLFGAALALYLPIVLAKVGQPLIIGLAVDQGYRTRDLSAVTSWAALYLLSVALQASLEMLQLYIMQRMGQGAVKRLRARLFGKIQRLSISYFDRVPLGRVMTRVTNDVESLSELFSSGAVQILGDLLYLSATVAMLFLVDWKLSFATISTLPILILGVHLFRVRARDAFRRVRARLSAINSYLQEHLSGMHIVQMFGQVQRVQDRFEDDNRGYMIANRDAIALDAGIYAFVDAMATVTVAIVLLVGAGLQDAGWLTLGILVAFVEALGRFFLPIRELSNKYTIIQSALTSAERIYELEDEEEPIKERHDPLPARFETELRFEDVRFAYGEGPEILKGVSFGVKKCERVAIVGHTGAGKSTIVKLVDRMYDVTGGRITLDGVDIRDVDLGGLRRLSTAVPQDVFLFSGDLRANIAYGAGDVSDEVLLNAVKACQAEGVLDRHGGLDATVSERGQNLSLGERQLLALVRALVTNPPILILDEATASVDRETERRLQVATERLMDGRTALIVAHRLSTIERCDRIVVLHGGEVVEEGSHAELMARGGRYATLVELQRREAA